MYGFVICHACRSKGVKKYCLYNLLSARGHPSDICVSSSFSIFEFDCS